MMRRALLLLCLAGAMAAQPALKPGRKYTTVERLAPERLQAVRAAREALARSRKPPPPVGVYDDIPAVLHVHAEDAPHTLGTRREALAAAKKAGIRAVFWSDHNGPKPDAWQGLREGVLLIAGAENGGAHELIYRNPAPGVRFHSHVEQDMQAAPDGWDGMEIYNRHADAEDDEDALVYLKKIGESPELLRAFERLVATYPDEIFGAECDYWPTVFELWDRISARRPLTGIGANDAHQNTLVGGRVLVDPYEVSFRNTVTHILARELSAKALLDSLRAGRAYVSHDWLADARGFSFVAVNSLGVYEMGDTIPIAGGTRLVARAPVQAHWKIFKDGKVAEERDGGTITHQAGGPGVYRAEAWLEIGGEMRPWIYSNAIRLARPAPGALALPSQRLGEGIETALDIEYTAGPAADAAKHQLDIYRPHGAKNKPILFFVHGGAWVRGDRKQYPFFGNYFAKAGYVVVVPSYRLAPKDPHPAQIEDVAAAFAWTVRNAAEQGGDPARIYIAGHSAGGHLAALLAADPAWLGRHGLDSSRIRGVMSLSGVPDIAGMVGEGESRVFGKDPAVLMAASPLHHVRGGLPPFLVSYCQWDYPALPQQARRFYEALRTSGVRADLVFVPAENHISEMTGIAKDSSTAAREMLRFMEASR